MAARSQQLAAALLSLLCGVSCFPLGQETKQTLTCGYESCHATKPNMLNVHLVPHTHDDVGWLKTVDQYYYGDRNDIQHAGVQYILDSVVDQLLKNPDRRFIYVETAFFYRWWKQQSSSMQQTVKQLVNEGRLEFVNGGWCMSDEATTHYSAVIDQMTMGLRFLNETFGPCGRPRVAWHIDPFGHAREHASMFAQMGYDGFFFGRLDYQDRARRMVKREQELLWRASNSLTPPMADLFTGILPNGYNPPEGFCWDQSCDDPPIRDDPDLEDYNVDDVVKRFLTIANSQAMVYKTNHIIMTMGSDFQYENANLWYKNLDKLIRYVNGQQANGSKVNVLYSTPSCYLQELHRANLTWALKTDDFFPYADDAHDFWTGYFTSRPALKRYERISNSNLQTCNQLEILGGPVSRKGPFGDGESQTMKKAMAVAQHHDAVSGTEKQHVANDYARRLANGWQHCQVLVSNSLTALSGSSAKRIYCDNLNISVCPLTESSKKFSVNVYNPLARPVAWPVRLPVNGTSYVVSDAEGKSVDCQVVPVSTSTRDVRRNRGFAVNELLFQVQAPPLGFTTYSVSLLQDGPPPASTQHRTPTAIQNKFIRVTFDPDTGLLSSLSNLETKQTIKLTQNFYWYNASDGNNKESNQPSGAYIFRPNSSTPFIISKTAKTESIQTPVVQEVRQWFAPWVSQVVRLYGDSRALELEWTVGPLPIDDDLGKELCVSVVFLQNGSLEIMLHRRLLYDDVRGVGEPLNESSGVFPEGLVVRGCLRLSLDRPPSAADAHRPLAQQVVLQPLLTFTDGDLHPNTQLEFSGLQAALPPAVHLLTLTQWDKDSVLLRLEHQFQSQESKVNSHPVTVNLQKLFSTLEVLGVSELNLSANQWKDDMTRFHWTPQTDEKPLLKTFRDSSVWEVTLRPMEIRTFLLRVSFR
uniref:Alpha-mannosidase n=1 Tax=Sander lucioperca TaxID=283035 RepID=A0A8C9Z7W3_SANLU